MVSQDVNPEGRGTALGLAIVRGLARAHGGDAWHELGEPTGACLVLRLPTGVPAALVRDREAVRSPAG